MMIVFDVLFFILPFVCLYLHIMSSKKLRKISFACAQSIVAGQAARSVLYYYDLSGGPDHGMEFLQLYLPMAIYILLTASGLIFAFYYEFKYQEKQ